MGGGGGGDGILEHKIDKQMKCKVLGGGSNFAMLQRLKKMGKGVFGHGRGEGGGEEEEEKVAGEGEKKKKKCLVQGKILLDVSQSRFSALPAKMVMGG